MTNPKTQSGCCEKCEKHVRDRSFIGSGSSRRSMTGVHVECKRPSCHCHLKTSSEWEEWRRTRTEVIGEMIENPDHIGIFPTTKCFNALDEAVNKLLTSTKERVREEVIQQIHSLPDERTTGIYKLVDAHKLVCLLQNHK